MLLIFSSLFGLQKQIFKVTKLAVKFSTLGKLSTLGSRLYDVQHQEKLNPADRCFQGVITINSEACKYLPKGKGRYLFLWGLAYNGSCGSW